MTGDRKSDEAFAALLHELAGDDPADTGPEGHTAVASSGLRSDRFRVARSLGEGGFGRVYEAVDGRDGRRVALKVLHRSNPSALLRFKREFRALADITHENLVRLDELVRQGDDWLLVMELVEGEPFDRYVAARPDKLRPAFGQLAAALSALHVAGKLHRDIKPSNVLVEAGGRVVVLDFGLIRELQADGSTVIAGTPHFMSPEQCAGGTLNASADWYAFGVMLYQALAGCLPFSGSPISVIENKQMRDPPAPPAGAPADLAALCLQLLAREPAERPGADNIAAAFDVAVEPTAATERQPFVGRDAELAALAGALADLPAEGAVTVFVRGESGVGKTMLVERFVETLGNDALVLRGRCYERESVPYKAVDSVVDALSAYLEELPRAQAAALMPRRVHELVRLFPTLGKVEAIADVPESRRIGLAEYERRREAFFALKELLARIADKRRLVLCIDDIQWGDVDSARLLAEVLSPPGEPQMLALLSHRSEAAEQSACLRELARLRTEDDRVVELRPLTAEQARDLAILLMPEADETLAGRLAAESEGHPYFLHQLARHAGDAAAGSLTLDGLIRARLARLSDGERLLLDVVAVAGQPIAQSVAVSAARAVSDPDAMTSLRTASLIRTQGIEREDAVEVFHDRIGETVLAALDPEERSRLHFALAVTLEGTQTPDVEALARHYHAAGERGLAAPYAERAADAAADALAFEHAASLYRLALELLRGNTDACRPLTVKLGEALVGAGRSRDGARAFLDAGQTAPQEQALSLRARAVRELLGSGHYTEGLGLLNEMTRTLGLGNPSSRARLVASIAYHAAVLRIRGLDFRQSDAGEAKHSDLVCCDLCVSGGLGLNLFDTLRATRFVLVGLRSALRCGETARVAAALSLYAVYAATVSAKPARGLEILSRAEALVRSDDAPLPLACVQFARGAIQFGIAHWAGALASFDGATEQLVARCAGEAGLLSLFRQAARYMLNRLGRVREGLERDELLGREAEARGDHLTQRHIDVFTRAHAHCADDDIEAARRCTARWHDVMTWPMGILEQAGVHVGVELYAGRPESARPSWERAMTHAHHMRLIPTGHIEHIFYGSCLELACWNGDDRSLRATARLLGHLRKYSSGFSRGVRAAGAAGIAWRRGDLERAVEAFGTAAAAYEESAMKLFAASCRRRQGELLGGDEGAALVQGSEAVMREEGVVNPERFSNIYAPHTELGAG